MLRALCNHAKSQNGSLAAVISPVTGVRWTYEDFFTRSLALAGGLKSFGYQRGDALVSDLPNIPENLLLQTACAQLGVAYCTAKDGPALQRLIEGGVRVRGGIACQPLLQSCEQFGLDPSTVLDVESPAYTELQTGPSVSFDPPADDAPWAYYGSPSGLSHGQIHKLGTQCQAALGLTEDDSLCVSITLCHSFGIGTAVGGAFLSGASVVLPAVGGIRGCGDPQQRADVTLDTMQSEAVTVLFADSHTLIALPPRDTTEGGLESLRTGVCKVGSGTDFLDLPEALMKGEMRPLRYAGVKLMGMGKKA